MSQTKKELETELESLKSNLPLKELSQDDLQKIKTALSDVVSDYLTNIEKKIEEKVNKKLTEKIFNQVLKKIAFIVFGFLSGIGVIFVIFLGLHHELINCKNQKTICEINKIMKKNK